VYSLAGLEQRVVAIESWTIPNVKIIGAQNGDGSWRLACAVKDCTYQTSSEKELKRHCVSHQHPLTFRQKGLHRYFREGSGTESFFFFLSDPQETLERHPDITFDCCFPSGRNSYLTSFCNKTANSVSQKQRENAQQAEAAALAISNAINKLKILFQVNAQTTILDEALNTLNGQPGFNFDASTARMDEMIKMWKDSVRAIEASMISAGRISPEVESMLLNNTVDGTLIEEKKTAIELGRTKVLLELSMCTFSGGDVTDIRRKIELLKEYLGHTLALVDQWSADGLDWDEL